MSQTPIGVDPLQKKFAKNSQNPKSEVRSPKSDGSRNWGNCFNGDFADIPHKHGLDESMNHSMKAASIYQDFYIGQIWKIICGWLLISSCLIAQAVSELQPAASESSSPVDSNVEANTRACRIGRDDHRLARCLEAATFGDDDAPYLLARAYSQGWYGAPVDQTEATKWYLVASKSRGGIAEVQLGMRYFCGVGVPQNDKEARAWFKKATEFGKNSGLGWMGFVEETGRGGEKNLSAAREWYERGADFQDEDSLFGLAMIYLENAAATADSADGQRYLQAAKRQIINMSVLGIGVYAATGEVAYSENRLSPATEKELLEKKRNQANLGDSNAMFDLGLAYSGGYGVKKDSVQAFSWFQIAANAHHAPAQFSLAQLYLRGWGVAKDLGKSADMFKNASDNGDIRATFALGWMVMQGIGSIQDAKTGLNLIRKAAVANNRDAQSILAVLYAEGRETPRDLSAAKEWWLRRLSCTHLF